MVPFVHEDAPDNGWNWFLLVIGSGYVFLVFSAVGVVLQRLVKEARPLGD
jgi:hypothetical protein